MPSPTRISSVQLARLIGTPDSPNMVDVCIPGNFAAYPHLFPNARRHAHTAIGALANGRWARDGFDEVHDWPATRV